MILDEIEAYLNAVTPSLGLTIKGVMPATPDECISIMESSGMASDLGFGMIGIKHEHPVLQLMVRGVPDDYEGPRLKIEQAYHEMSKIQGMTLSGVNYLFVRPKQAPYLLARDDSKRVRFAVNFSVDKEPS